MSRMTLLALLVFTLPVNAQSIHKCRDPRGNPIYQSGPCQDGQAEKRWDTQDSRSTREDIERRQQAERKIARDRQQVRTRNARMARAPRGTGIHIAPQRDAGRCEAAKAHRDAKLKQTGLKRTFQLMRQLDDDVWRACN